MRYALREEDFGRILSAGVALIVFIGAHEEIRVAKAAKQAHATGAPD